MRGYLCAAMLGQARERSGVTLETAAARPTSAQHATTRAVHLQYIIGKHPDHFLSSCRLHSGGSAWTDGGPSILNPTAIAV